MPQQAGGTVGVAYGCTLEKFQVNWTLMSELFGGHLLGANSGSACYIGADCGAECGCASADGDVQGGGDSLRSRRFREIASICRACHLS